MATNVEVAEQTDNYLEKLVSLNRVAKVVKGGRQFGFTALTVVGDGNGKVGVGYGKAKEVPVAIQKAMQNGRKQMRDVPLINGTVHYPIIRRRGAVRIIILPASEGTGIIAGGMMRAVFEVLGVRNVVAKCLGSRNPINVVGATVDSLCEVQSPSQVAKKRGKTIAEIRGAAAAKAIAEAEAAAKAAAEEADDAVKTNAPAAAPPSKPTIKPVPKPTPKPATQSEAKPAAESAPKPAASAPESAAESAPESAAKSEETKQDKTKQES